MKKNIADVDLEAFKDGYLTTRWLEREGIEVGKNGMAYCPFHAESTPSFKVYPDGHWHCFGGCGNGDLFDLLGKLRFGDSYTGKGEHFIEVVDMVAGLGVAPLPVEERVGRARKQHEAPTKEEVVRIRENLLLRAWDAYEYLIHQRPDLIQVWESWGITEEQVHRHHLGWDGRRFTIPAQYRGVVFAVKRRIPPDGTEEPKYIQSTGSRWGLFNGDVVGDTSPFLILTEDEKSALALEAQGLPVISSTGGAGFWQSGKAGWWARRIFHVPTLIFWRDADELKGVPPEENMGMLCARAFRDRFPRARIVDSYPYKDAGDYLEAGYDWRDVINPDWLSERGLA